MTTDNVADMLTRIRNANMIRHRIVYVLKTKCNISIAKILKEEGYITEYSEFEENKKQYLLISLRYYGIHKKPVITAIKRTSKPGLRIYVNKKNLPNVLSNLGIAILSTSKGIMTNQKAKVLGIGGEVICYIW